MTPGFWLGRPDGSRYRPSGLGTEAEGQVSGESDAVGHSGEEKFLFFLLSSSRPTADSQLLPVLHGIWTFHLSKTSLFLK